MGVSYDFSGWATKNDLLCSDGRTIRRNAFKDCDGKKVPLVWNHQHNEPENVLGHAILENRDEGVYAYCSLNDTEKGQQAKALVRHGDVMALSIYANKLRQKGGDVLHGAIREVSLVIAGANPEAFIDSVIEHGDASDFDGIIYNAYGTVDFEPGTIIIKHSEETKEEEEPVVEEKQQVEEEVIEHAEGKAEEGGSDGETLQDIFNTLSDKQKNMVYALVGMASEKDAAKHSDTDEKGDDETMKHNVFDNEEMEMDNALTHSEMMEIIGDAKRFGSMKESVLQHGIQDIEMLFPEVKSVNGNTPEWIKRPDEWVSKVMNGVKKSPFSRIKTSFADITEDEARAKGYLPDRTETYRDSKGNLIDKRTGKPAYKKEEVFSLLKRTTSPTTIYKKQKLDRDDVVDITDFDVVAWIKGEMRMMLDEEIARAILVGDGRLASDDDKINETNIRPIWKEEDLFVVRTLVDSTAAQSEDQQAKAFIRAAIKARKNYRGSGNPTCFMTEDMLTNCLLLEDNNGRVIYDTEEKLRTALRVSSIVTVPVMENLRREEGGKDRNLVALIVNLNDYNVGADKGGAVNMFDDFDIDYNAQKYLIETRCSGALIKPYSAIIVELGEPSEA